MVCLSPEVMHVDSLFKFALAHPAVPVCLYQVSIMAETTDQMT